MDRDILYDENLVNGLPKGTLGRVQAGITNADNGSSPEQGFTLPWVMDKQSSWLDYSCTLAISLDAGIALHKALPQGSMPIDTLGRIDAYGHQMDVNLEGVKTTSRGAWHDTAQRMASATYRFVLYGGALRAGYKIPIPKLVSIAGVPAIPDARQWSTQAIIGNLSGIPLQMAQWELWYFIIVPPTKDTIPPPNIAEHVSATTPLPKGIQVPYAPPDDESVKQVPQTKDFFV